MHGKSLPRGTRATPWKGCQTIATTQREGLQRDDVQRAMPALRESVAARSVTISTQTSEMPRNNRTAFASTFKRPVEIQRPSCPHGHGSMVMQVTPQQSLGWECTTCGVALFDGRCDLTDAETPGTHRSLVSHREPRNNHLYLADGLEEPKWILRSVTQMSTRARRTARLDLEGLRSDASRGTVLGAR